MFHCLQKNRILGRLAIPVAVIILVASMGCSGFMEKASVTGFSTGSSIFAGPTIHMMVDELMDTDNVRLVREGIGGAMVLISALADMHPKDLEIQSKAAYLNCCYGLLVEKEDPRFASQLYNIARTCGIRALRTNGKFRDGLDSGEKVGKLVGHLGKDYVEPLVWTASAQMLYLLQNRNDFEAQLEVPESLEMVKRAMEIDPDYLFGTSQMFIAIYYALIPEFMGVGSGPTSSAKMFQQARDVTGGKNLMVDLYEARFLSINIGDRQRFTFLLNRILETDPRVLEGGVLLNDFAQKQARYWLDQETELF